MSTGGKREAPPLTLSVKQKIPAVRQPAARQQVTGLPQTPRTPSIAPSPIRAEIRFTDIRTTDCAEIRVPIDILRHINPHMTVANWRELAQWEIFEMADPAIEIVMAAVVKVLGPASGKWKVVSYDLDWGTKATRVPVPPTITFRAMGSVQHSRLSFMYVNCRRLTNGVLDCTAEYKRSV